MTGFDVAGRLAQGRPSVEALSEYVWAAHQVGFTDVDLTLHPGQVRDWYGAEDGMDLAVLERDCASLDAAVRATLDALAVQEEQTGVLTGAWQGVGAQAARQFLHRHGVASAAVADALTAAATALQRTLEQLWRAVDAKVDTTVDIESGVGAAREQWRAAAHTVTTGAGDRVAATELVDGAVKPFVENKIGGEWLTAMQATGATVTEAYRTAAAEISGRAPARFDIPGELGPNAPSVASPAAPSAAVTPAPAAVSAPAVGPAATAPAAWTAPPPAATPAAAPVPPPAAPPPAPAPLPESAAPLGSSAAMPAVGQRFADALSGLLGGGTGDGPLGDALDPPADPEPPEFADDDEEPEDEPDDEEPEEDDEPVAEDPADEPVPEDEEPVEEAEPEPAPAPEPTPPEPTPPPPPAEPLPPPPSTEERTPCEIAADEVPQVGPPPATGPGGG